MADFRLDRDDEAVRVAVGTIGMLRQAGPQAGPQAGELDPSLRGLGDRLDQLRQWILDAAGECPTRVLLRTTTVPLASPLAARRVIDRTTGRTLAVAG